MFLLLPVGVDYRARRYPVVTFTLMGICAAIYLLTLVFQLANGSEATFRWTLKYLWLTPAQSHWWTYLTSLFVHEGFFHLAGNMVYLFLFGSCVEDVLGRPRFVAFYLFCGLVSEFSYIAIASGHFASAIPLGGASGAISGCIGGFLLLFLRTKIEFKWVLFFFFRLWNGEFFLPAWLVISFWFATDLLGMLLSMGEQAEGVAFGAHVGGTLCGLGWLSIEKMSGRGRRTDDLDEEEPRVEQKPAVSAGAVVSRSPIRAPMRVQLKAVPVAFEIPTIHLYLNGTQTGPFTLTQVRQMFSDGTISMDTLYWQESMQDWRCVEELRPVAHA